MNKNRKRLSKGFWHKFIPNTSKLISPQTMKFEIWDLETHKIIEKWDPKVYCISNCAFNQSGNKFILSAGCMGGESEFRIYDTNTFELLNEFWFPEQSGNAVFNVEGDAFIFGTWDGNVYKIGINDKIILNETKIKIDNKTYKDYTVSPENNNKLLHVEDSMITRTETGMESQNIFFVVSPKYGNRTTKINLFSDYILVYNLKTQSQTEIRLPIEDKIYKITGMKYHNGKLAIMKSVCGEKENGYIVNNADLYIFNFNNGDLQAIKESFKIRDVFANAQTLSWNRDEKLASIALSEVSIIDTKNNFEEIVIPFDKPTSVEFSEDGKLIAIGGDKAALYKLT